MAKSKIQEAFNGAKNVAELVQGLINDVDDLDLQRLLKQIEADLMDVQHKLAIAVRLSEKD